MRVLKNNCRKSPQSICVDNLKKRCLNFKDLKDFILNKMQMAQGKNYQPIMIRTLIQNNGVASKEKIKEHLLKENPEYDLDHFSNCEVFRVLTSIHSVAIEDKEKKEFRLVDFESFSTAEKSVIVRYCNQKIDRPFAIKLTVDSVDDVILEFKEWLETDEAKNHLNIIENEKKEVKELVKKLDEMDKDSQEFVDWILHGLLPHFKTQYAKRESTFPVFLNIKSFFKRYEYTDDDWKNISFMIYNLVKNFQKEPEKIGDWIKEFTSNKKYIRNIQTAAISPILFCLNDNFPLVNNRIRQTYKEFANVFDWNEKMSRKIEDYVKSSQQIKKLIDRLQVEELKNLAIFDVFCYWYDYIRKQDDDDDDDEGTDIINKVVKNVDYDGFFQSVDFDNFKKFEPHLLRNPERVKIRDILQFCDEGKWRLPNFQRYFDWKQKDIRDLLESIFRDYYVGSFLMWDTDETPPVGLESITGSNPSKDSRTLSIILDGQQRMTSVYYAIKSPSIQTRRIKKPVYFYIDFNTFFSETDREKKCVIVLDKKLDDEESFNSLYFPLYELEKYDDWIERFEKFILNKTSENEKFHKMRRIIEKKVKHIYDGFEIPYISLPTTMGLPEVIDIFEQINTRGKTLNVFDLLIAKLSPYTSLKTLWRESVRNFDNIKNYKSMEKLPIYILQSISLYYHKTNSCKNEDILKIYENIFESSELSFEDVWEEFSTYVDLAIRRLENPRDGFGVKDKRSLPYAPTIPILASLLKDIEGRPNKAECNNKLDIWYWSSVFGDAFSGAVDSQLTADFSDMRKWFEKNETPRIVERVRREYKTTVNLRNVQSTSNAMFRGILSLVALKGGYDFDTNRSFENARSNDRHHIFPKAPFKNPQVNTILNQTWLSKETNQKIIRAKAPSKYIQEFIDDKYNGDILKFKEVLKTHFINEEAYNSMMNDNFKEFINEREKVLMDEIGKRIGLDNDVQNETMLHPQREFDNEVLVEDTFQKCNEHVHWIDGYFRPKGLKWISRYLPKNKVKQIKILTSKDTATEELRDSFKSLRKQLSHDEITCEMRVITDNKLKQKIHGRWLITKNDCFTFQSVDTVSRGSYDEIRGGASEPPFEAWWNESLDIIEDWNKIQESK
jgi:hypothetical protein